MSTITHTTKVLEGYPNFYVARSYFEALMEAAKFIKEHIQDEIFPEEDCMDIVKKGIGPMPTINGTLTSNEINSIQLQYHRAEYLFLRRAFCFSR